MEVNQISDTFLFVIILISIGFGWTLSYINAFGHGYTHAQSEMFSEYPIVNIEIKQVDEELFQFRNMFSNELLITDEFDACMEKMHELYSGKHIICSRISTEEEDE